MRVVDPLRRPGVSCRSKKRPGVAAVRGHFGQLHLPGSGRALEHDEAPIRRKCCARHASNLAVENPFRAIVYPEQDEVRRAVLLQHPADNALAITRPIHRHRLVGASALQKRVLPLAICISHPQLIDVVGKRPRVHHTIAIWATSRQEVPECSVTRPPFGSMYQLTPNSSAVASCVTGCDRAVATSSTRIFPSAPT